MNNLWYEPIRNGVRRPVVPRGLSEYLLMSVTEIECSSHPDYTLKRKEKKNQTAPSDPYMNDGRQNVHGNYWQM